MSVKRAIIALLVSCAACLLLIPERAGAQFYHVYPWETPGKGWLEANYWTTWVGSSDLPYAHFGETLGAEGLWSHALELEYGFTDRFVLGVYADFDDPRGGPLRYTRTRIEGRYRFSNRYDRFVNPALYFELYLPTAAYDAPQELEVRLILERDLNDFRLDLNPLLEKELSGADVGSSFDAGIDAGIYYRRFYRLQPGIEIFSRFGELNELPSQSDQPHVLFGTVDVRPARGWDLQLGAGYGLTDASNRWSFKSTLTWEFQTISPGDQANP